MPSENAPPAETGIPEMSPEAFDAHFRAQWDSPLLTELWSRAWGEEYPIEIRPNSGCPWRLLGLMVADLRPEPGALIVDLGCGPGGPGLWLARALGGRLIGVDRSAVAVEIARERAPEWLPEGHAEFRTGTFEATDLPTSEADVVISVDALALAPEPVAAFAEARRILRPGGVLMFTCAEPRAGLGEDGSSSWNEFLSTAGLRPGGRVELPDEGAAWGRLYASIREHEGDLRRQMGDRATDALLTEAAMVGPHIAELSWGVVRAEAPL